MCQNADRDPYLSVSPSINLCMSVSLFTSLRVCLEKEAHGSLSGSLPRYEYMHLTHLTLGRPQRPRRQDAETKAWHKER